MERGERELVMPGAPSIDPVKAARALNLAEMGYGKQAIADQTGINRHSVHDILDRVGHWAQLEQTPVFRELRREQNRALEQAWQTGQAQCLALAFEPARLAKMSSYQLVGMAGIANQNSRLLAGESTQNIELHAKHEVSGLDNLCQALSQVLIERRESNDSLPETNKP